MTASLFSMIIKIILGPFLIYYVYSFIFRLDWELICCSSKQLWFPRDIGIVYKTNLLMDYVPSSESFLAYRHCCIASKYFNLKTEWATILFQLHLPSNPSAFILFFSVFVYNAIWVYWSLQLKSLMGHLFTSHVRV